MAAMGKKEKIRSSRELGALDWRMEGLELISSFLLRQEEDERPSRRIRKNHELLRS